MRLDFVEWTLYPFVVNNLLDKRYSNQKYNKKETETLKGRKAIQYVTSHLCLGKMLAPDEQDDPLFTRQHYDDPVLQEQIGPENYAKFRKLILDFLPKMQTENLRKKPHYSFDRFMTDMPLNSVMKQRLLELRGILIKKGFSKEQTDLEMSALLLRYLCLGINVDSSHSGIPVELVEKIQDYTECFASPLTHLFQSYYSFFDEDKIFGSHGNFFGTVRRHERIPDKLVHAHLEMNPIWTNEVYDEIYKILQKSMNEGVDMEVFLIAPGNWVNQSWEKNLTDLSKKYEDYKKYSTDGRAYVDYTHQINLHRYNMISRYWWFSPSVPIPKVIQIYFDNHKEPPSHAGAKKTLFSRRSTHSAPHEGSKGGREPPWGQPRARQPGP